MFDPFDVVERWLNGRDVIPKVSAMTPREVIDTLWAAREAGLMEPFFVYLFTKLKREYKQ